MNSNLIFNRHRNSLKWLISQASIELSIQTDNKSWILLYTSYDMNLIYSYKRKRKVKTVLKYESLFWAQRLRNSSSWVCGLKIPLQVHNTPDSSWLAISSRHSFFTRAKGYARARCLYVYQFICSLVNEWIDFNKWYVVELVLMARHVTGYIRIKNNKNSEIWGLYCGGRNFFHLWMTNRE